MVDYDEELETQGKFLENVANTDTTSTQTDPKFFEENKEFNPSTTVDIMPAPVHTTENSLPESPRSKMKKKWKFRKEKIVNEVIYQTSGNSISKAKFHKVATRFARTGFFFKALLYASISVLSISAALDAKHNPAGPQSLFQDLKDTLSAVVLIILIVGLFCYSSFGIFYGIFNIDQIPNSVGNYLKRFGRCVSALFYAVLGIDGILILVNASDPNKENQNEIVGKMFQSKFGQVLLVLLAIVFFIVSITYFYHACTGKKFRCELATERLGRRRFTAFVIFARVGALGRVLFFGTFGGAICKLLSETNNGNGNQTENSQALNIEGVLVIAAQFSPVFLFIVASLLLVYACWNLILCAYRRIPAHPNQIQALGALGINRSLKSLNLPPENPATRTLRASIKRTRMVQTTAKVVEYVDPIDEESMNPPNNEIVLSIPNLNLNTPPPLVSAGTPER